MDLETALENTLGTSPTLLPPSQAIKTAIGSPTTKGEKRATRDYERELNELRTLLDQQKKLNEDLMRFKEKYNQSAKERTLTVFDQGKLYEECEESDEEGDAK